MKKMFLLLLAGILCLNASFGQGVIGDMSPESGLPFSKLIFMSHAELNDAHFRFIPSRNRYQIKKADFWGAMEERAKKTNYKIVVQYGKTGVAYVRVDFTNPNAYHEVMDYILNNVEDYTETVSQGRSKITFEQDGIKCELRRVAKRKAVTVATDDLTYARTMDLSHENFTFTITTGKEPDSRWHDRQKKKEGRRVEKNRRARSVMEFM